MSNPQPVEEGKKYFITVEYRNYLSPINGRWQNNTGLQICNGFINQHPVSWLAKQQERQRLAWDEEKDHTSFCNVLFYAPLQNEINTDCLQDLS